MSGEYAKLSFNAVRNHIDTGDQIAFCGRGLISSTIKFFRSLFSLKIIRVTHIAVVYDKNKLVEVTTIGFKPYAIKRDIEDAIASYKGDIYILPLARRYRDLGREAFARNWLDQIAEEKVGYDYWQMLRSAITTWWKTKESKKRLYCSELGAWVLKIMCLVNLNASEVPPDVLIRFKVYAPTYWCVKGSGKPLKYYNTLEPEGYGYAH